MGNFLYVDSKHFQNFKKWSLLRISDITSDQYLFEDVPLVGRKKEVNYCAFGNRRSLH